MCQYTVVATALDMYTDSNTRQRSVICSEALHVNLLMHPMAHQTLHAPLMDGQPKPSRRL
jgi:hypothetical protein